jgi:Zinc knuckle
MVTYPRRIKVANSQTKCFKCQEKGHFARDCPTAAAALVTAAQATTAVRRIVLDAPSRRMDPYAPPSGIKITVVNTGK